MQRNELKDDVCISVREKFNNLSLSPSECCVFRVHDQLRKVNERAYEPAIIAIGPYHRGKENLLMMEEHKLRYLQYFFQQREHESLLKYVDALRTREGEICKCYAKPLEYINSNDFIEMMLLDGFFIVELMRKFDKKNLRERNDPIFEIGWISYNLGRDLLLFENQIPFFVLDMLFRMINVLNHDLAFSELALKYFACQTPILKGLFGNFQDENTEHLLGLVYRKLVLKAKVENKEKDWSFIQCATELREVGIWFWKTEADDFFDIKFENGVIQIPRLLIDDRIESFFRNLGAYEQYRNNIDFHLVSDYLTFMDCLVNSPKDVEILSCREIIDNWKGDDEVVSTMFNKIGDSVVGPDKLNFYYGGIFNEINRHYKYLINHRMKRINRWMENLWKNYLSSPWAIISVLAAFVLLVLTFLQTVFTMKS